MFSADIPLCAEHVRKIYFAYEQRRFPEGVERTRRIEDRERAIQKREDDFAAGRREARRDERKNRQGFVYYILVGKHIKIGYTINLSSRVKSYPPDSTVLGIETGTEDLERERHQQFDAYRALAREWFIDAPEIRSHIDTTCTPWSPSSRARSGPAGPAVGKIRYTPRTLKRARSIM